MKRWLLGWMAGVMVLLAAGCGAAETQTAAPETAAESGRETLPQTDRQAGTEDSTAAAAGTTAQETTAAAPGTESGTAGTPEQTESTEAPETTAEAPQTQGGVMPAATEGTEETPSQGAVPDASDIRILPAVLHGDDTVVGQVTVPGPDAGDYSLYQPEMFYGRWRVEDNAKYKDHSVTGGMLSETLVGISGEEIRPEALPWYFGFGIIKEGPYYKSLPLYLDTATTGYCTFGNGTSRPDSQDVVMMVYDVSGDTLAIGFVDVPRDEIREGRYEDIRVIRELRYTIVDWTGCRLTLRYGDREVTYIPDSGLKQTNGVYELGWDRTGYLSKNCTPQGNPYSIGKGGQANFNNGYTFGHIETALTLNEAGGARLEVSDGGRLTWNYTGGYATVKEGRDGKAYAYVDEDYSWYDEEAARFFVADRMVWDYDAFYYSQNALTLRCNGSNLVYLSHADWDGSHLVWDPDAEQQWFPAETESFDEGTCIVLNGEKLNEDLGYTVSELIGLGFATEADVTAPVGSRIVCEAFEMTKDGVAFSVRAVNPYAQDVPLNDCIVCFFGFDDTTGAVTVEGGISCGTAKKEDVTALYRHPFIEEEDHLVYQTANPEHDYANAYGAFVISEDVRTADVLFCFDGDGVLKQIVFLAPYLLYNTLADNLGEVDLAALDPEDLDETLRVRDEILAQLQEAFAGEGITVAIDEITGKITLDNRILFAFNRYDLTDDGKACIDGFLKAYAEVLLSGEHADAVKGVQFDGHTDTVGRYEYNLELSQKRAETVLAYCVGENNAGLTAEQTAAFAAAAVAVGHSFDEPVLGADGRVDMDASRRVEIRFYLNVGGRGE